MSALGQSGHIASRMVQWAGGGAGRGEAGGLASPPTAPREILPCPRSISPPCPNECAAFPKGTGNGHHLINRSGAIAVYLEVGSRQPEDVTTCSDIDMMSPSSDGRFLHKNGTPY